MKRILDVLIAAIALLLLLPVLAVLAVLIRVKLGKPVLFRQTRPGLHGQPFEVIKFRTMTNAAAPDGTLLSDAERLTAFGRFLRASSLDELPELWLVLKGDMSLVGPRPLLTKYLPLYSAEQARRHEVRPGITGWAQVNGRNALSWDERLKLDTWYVDNHSTMLDLKILFLTVFKVLRREGITAKGHATVNEFQGSTGSGSNGLGKLAIVGAGGHGKVVADAAERAGWQAIDFFDDDPETDWQKADWPLRGNVQDLLAAAASYDGAIIAIGNNQIRLRLSRRLQDTGIPLATICHPSAVVSQYATLGAGSVVCAGAVINIDAQVGMAAIINTGATVDHDCQLGAAVHVCPGVNLAGGVKIADRAWIGIGASVKEYISIGSDVVVGAGAAVLHDVDDATTVTGIPARAITKDRDATLAPEQLSQEQRSVSSS